jgi:hypothetical protein
MLPTVLAHPGVRTARSQDVMVAVASKVERASVPLWPAHGAVAPEAEISSFELPIRRSEGINAAFPVEITGAGAARESMTVVLRDMPESTWLSKGQRQDATTWLLRPADLNNLRMSVYEGTPDAFDVTIEVTTASGDPAARSIRPRPPARYAGAARAVRRYRRYRMDARAAADRRRGSRSAIRRYFDQAATAGYGTAAESGTEAAARAGAQAGAGGGASGRAAHHASGRHERPRHGHARARSRRPADVVGSDRPRRGPASPTCPAATDGCRLSRPPGPLT